jgi:tetrahydromethanopterin S-methyltransferase subunit G
MGGTDRIMAEEKTQENREDIIRVTGELKLINQKLDNHISHMSQKIDTIFKIVWTVSFMVLGLILKAIYTGLLN